MNKLISDFELHTGLTPKEGFKLLGVAHSTYQQYRSGMRVVPAYIEHSIKFVMLLSNSELNTQIRKYVFQG